MKLEIRHRKKNEGKIITWILNNMLLKANWPTMKLRGNFKIPQDKGR